MAHLFESGVFGEGKTAWHYLGSTFDGLLTMEDALVKSGVDFGVSMVPVYVQVPDLANPGQYILTEIQGKKACVRSDDHAAVMEIHGDDYTPINYRPFFEALGFGDTPVVASMVLLKKGRIAACSIRLPDLDRVLADKSNLKVYVTAYTSHDGTYAGTYKDSNIRAECANRVAMIDRESGGRTIRVTHRSEKTAERISEAAAIMTYAQERANAAEKLCVDLLAKRVDRGTLQTILERTFPIVPNSEGEVTDRVRTIAENKRRQIKLILWDAPDLQDVKDTAWGVYQAFTNWTDHAGTYRNTKDSTRDENRLISTHILKNTVAEQALAVLQAL
jgi:phage/plasmid-like protein (TIGR03299 family)